MENSSRYKNDQYGNDDYAQLDRWSGHIEYKRPAQESLIYTSDYGSYSSQESNHSGTTYSNLADCEEALYSPPAVAYDLPPPQYTSTMERRRDKPLPPPRMTSKVQTTNAPRLPQPAKEKKISFDDSSLAIADKSQSSGDYMPSFATLPRKKKLVSKPTSNNTQSAPQVTWMKEVAQKAESVNRPKSANANNSPVSNKKPHGILKNKIEEQKKGDTTGYIKRNTVQRILDQQKTARNRQSAGTLPKPQYKSLSSLPPQTSADSESYKAWEYNFNVNNSSSSATAQVIGVLEPNADGVSQNYNHIKQNSAETEFEFPPPPSAHDIKEIMVSGNSTSPKETPSNDFTPLKLACTRRTEAYQSKGVNSNVPTPTTRNLGLKSRENVIKPPVPQRPKKNIALNNNGSNEKQALTDSTSQKSMNNEWTVQAKQPKVPPKRIAMRNKPETVAPTPQPASTPTQQSYPSMNSVVTQSTNDIVLPPPVEFQEGSSCSPLASQQPSYGDYELLTQDSTYPCSIHQPSAAHNSPKPYTDDQRHYHHRIAVNQLGADLHDNLKVTPPTAKQRTGKPMQGNGYSPYYSKEISSNNTGYPEVRGNRSRFINHQHQYSTEL